MGAGRLRRRAHQHYRIHVGRGEGRGMGDAAAHPAHRAHAHALDLGAAAGLRLHRHHDRGNLAALTQTNTKRLLAYSSIAHVGYMLLGLIASDGRRNSARTASRAS